MAIYMLCCVASDVASGAPGLAMIHACAVAESVCPWASLTHNEW